MIYELIDYRRVSCEEWGALIDEFTEHGEFCNAIWRAYMLGVDEWLRLPMKDTGEEEYQLAFLGDGHLLGAVRVTPHPRNEANGKVGYYIRPKSRGMRHSQHMLHLIEDFCCGLNLDDVTAVTDDTNNPSIHALFSAQWVCTGRSFRWTYGRRGLEFRPEK